MIIQQEIALDNMKEKTLCTYSQHNLSQLNKENKIQ